MIRTRTVAALCLGVAILGAGPHASRASTCSLPDEKVMESAQLFFGRSLPGGSEVSDRAWRAFEATTLSHYFPEGFTDFDAVGQWQDPKTHAIVHERTKVVEVVAPAGKPLDDAISAVSAAFRDQFHQQSVGVVTSPACAAF